MAPFFPLLDLCASQNFTSFDVQQPVKLSHLWSGGPLCGCVIVRLVCNWALVLVRMPHPSAAACQDVPSFVRWPIVCVCDCKSLGPCASQDAPSFGSSLSRCPIFHQVAHCVCVIVRLVCNWVLVLVILRQQPVKMSHCVCV